MSVLTWIGIAVAGAIGAVARYVGERFITAVHTSRFPFGTFAINMSGSLVFGFVSGLGLYHGFPNAPKLILTTGFCGAYTTFSTFSYETVRLSETGHHRVAASYLGASVVVGWCFAAIGLAVASLA